MAKIADLPAHERPRERLMATGGSALSDRELLALLLGTGGSRGVGAHELAERLLAGFGSLDRLARAHPAELASVSGIGTAKAASLVAAFELANRSGASVTRPQIKSTSDIAGLVVPALRGLSRERAIVVVCNRAGRVLARETLTEGTADRTLLPVREILVTVLRHDGQSFAVAHNHPSGDPTPSGTDIEATHRMVEAARAAGLRFLDHVIIAGNRWQRVQS